ncbi:hypothetical protein PROPHICCUG48898T2_52 [Mycobacterium phage CCUG48898T-2]|nr:hypothetical protein PROPHICCUG48898T2_52 [Mycobacterium phage CCUG48898T-2]
MSNPFRRAITDLEEEIAATDEQDRLRGLYLALASAKAAEAKFFPGDASNGEAL